MAAKKTSLLDTLEQTAKGIAETLPPPPPERRKVQVERQASRVGKINVSAYFSPAVRSSILLLRARYPDRTVQDLLAEALNDLFAKYNIPQTARLDE